MSIESHLTSESSKKPRHFKDVAKKLLLGDEMPNTRPWVWEEEISPNDWLEIEKFFEGGIEVRKFWDGLDQRLNYFIKSRQNEPPNQRFYGSNENLHRYVSDLIIKCQCDYVTIGYVVLSRLVNGSRSIVPGEKLFEYLETKLSELKKQKDFCEYFYTACAMRLLVAYKVEMTDDLKIIITDKPPTPKLNTEIPKRPTRIKKI